MLRSARFVALLGALAAPAFGQSVTFAPPVPISLGGDAAVPIAADLDLDGISDLLAVDGARNELWIFYATPGGFEPGTVLATGSWPSGIAVGDVNNDCLPDIVVTNRSDDTMSVFLRGIDGSYRVTSVLPANDGPRRLQLEDMNHDAVLDAIVMRHSGVDVHLGDGAGSFTPAGTITASNMNDFTMGDLDHDGDLDVMLTRNMSGTGSGQKVYGDGQGGFQASVSYSFNNPTSALVGDFDNNGLDDWAFSTTSTTIWGCHFTSAWEFNLPTGGNAFQPSDFNGDGKIDFVIDSREIWMNTGNHSWTHAQDLPGANGMAAIADFNGDGAQDVVTGDGAGGLLAYYRTEPWTQRPSDGHWFRRIGPLSWSLAQARAESWGGNLAALHNAAMHVFVRDNVQGNVDCWIGYSDAGSEGNWSWTAGGSATWTNWAPGDPDGGVLENAAFLERPHGMWRDGDALEAKYVIVEIVSNDVDADGVPDVFEIATGAETDFDGNGIPDSQSSATVCTGSNNSTGAGATLTLGGEPSVGVGTLELNVAQAPARVGGMFLMAENQGLVLQFLGGRGNLCLGGGLVRISDMLRTSPAGTVHHAPDLVDLGPGAAIAFGETRYIQFLYRDAPVAGSSNLSDAVAVMFTADPRPELNLSAPCFALDEYARTVELGVVLSRAHHEDITFRFEVDGTATEGVDWRVGSNREVLIPAGATGVELPVLFFQDTGVEADEIAIVRLVSSDGAALGEDVEFRVTIRDDD
ncbi:MAG: hypothetical protein GY711_17510 [bacterium]|nr:hypothetical protein [bacterium]